MSSNENATEEFNLKETLKMEENLSGKEKATKHGVDRKLLLEGINILSKISAYLQRDRTELEMIKDEKKEILKIMQEAAEKQNKFLELKNSGYINFFDQNSTEVRSIDNAPESLRIEELNQLTYNRHMQSAEMYSDPYYYYRSPRYR